MDTKWSLEHLPILFLSLIAKATLSATICRLRAKRYCRVESGHQSYALLWKSCVKVPSYSDQTITHIHLTIAIDTSINIYISIWIIITIRYIIQYFLDIHHFCNLTSALTISGYMNTIRCRNPSPLRFLYQATKPSVDTSDDKTELLQIKHVKHPILNTPQRRYDTFFSFSYFWILLMVHKSC